MSNILITTRTIRRTKHFACFDSGSYGHRWYNGETTEDVQRLVRMGLHTKCLRLRLVYCKLQWGACHMGRYRHKSRYP